MIFDAPSSVTFPGGLDESLRTTQLAQGLFLQLVGGSGGEEVGGGGASEARRVFWSMLLFY